jgi:RHH-type proline utilization regulon transcriptional repressor/proline dehydrogenase/delta 1-pyrroline-5-carboxylate dehydrogenase
VAEGATEALGPLWGLPLRTLDGQIDPEELTTLPDLALVSARGPVDWLRRLRQALAARPGPIVALVTGLIVPERYSIERHLCIDVTAAGGNASLLATSG